MNIHRRSFFVLTTKSGSPIYLQSQSRSAYSLICIRPVPDNLLQETYHNAINLILQPLYDGGQRADRYITIATEQIKSIAFPFISSGIYAFPRPKAAAIALDTLIKELRTLDQNEPNRELTIRIVLFSDADLELFSEMYQKTQIMNLWPL